MRYAFLIAAVFIAGSAHASFGQNTKTIVGFYPIADSISSFPSTIDRYEIKCQKKLMKRWVTFIGRKKEKKVIIAAVTLQPIKNIKKELSLTVQFQGPKPILGEISTWGYVFDRNGDGKLDYLALVSGAAAVEDDNFPDDFPGFGSPMNVKQFETYISHCQILFNHWADDNNDGFIDAGVHFEMDPFRNWVKRQLLIRSTKFNGVFDDVQAFRKKITAATRTVDFTPTEIPYYPLGSNKGKLTKAIFDEQTGILTLLNRAAALCKLGAGGF